MPGSDVSSGPGAHATRLSHTPDHLVEKILRSKAAIEGERKQVTVLFADVTESMALAEEVDAEAWHGIIDEFFGILTRGVHRFEGTINQYMGDGVMALFGAPIAHEDHAQRACYAALAILEDLTRFADEMRRMYGLNFSVRIGINSGEVVVGKIGDDLRMDYTALGHTVGLAARVEALAAPNTAYLTDHTAKLARGYFALDDLGAFTLKGVREPLKVWRLAGVGQARTRLDISRARGLTRFVGRRDEIRLLEDALAAAKSGERRVVGVIGEAGAGKSRLCFEFIERAKREGVALYEAHCVAHGSMIPFLPALELIRAYSGVSERDDARAAREKIAGRVVLSDPTMADTLPLVFDFMGIADPAHPPPALEPEVRRRILFDHLRLLLEMVARAHTSIVLCEDMHWIDGASAAFMAEYLELAAGLPVLVLLNARPGYKAPCAGEPYYSEISVGPLREDAVRELLAELLGNDASVHALADRIAERTAGNPFFVEEVVRELAESGALAGERGAYKLLRQDAAIAIPATVQAVLAARVDRLPEVDKELLETAAVIGKRFGATLLYQATSQPANDVASMLSRLVDGGFIAEAEAYPEAVYVFQHPLTQEVTYHMQLSDRRAGVHKRVAEALEENCLCGEGRDEIAGLLAHHWEGAGDLRRAVTWRKKAAEWASARDLREAERHWQSVRELLSRCHDCPEGVAVGIVAREALMEIGWKLGRRVDDARTLYEEGKNLAERAGDPAAQARVMAAFAMAELFAGHVASGLQRLEDAAMVASRAKDRTLSVSLEGRIAYMYILRGRLGEALGMMDKVLAGSSGDERVEPGTSDWFAAFRTLPLAYLGRLQEASQVLDEVFDKVRAAGNPASLATMCGLAVTVAWFRGDAGRALDLAQEQMRIAEKLRTPTLLAGAYDSMGVACMLRDAYGDALEYAERALGIARKSGTLLQSEAVFVGNLAAAYVGVGDLNHGLACAREAVAIARERHTPLFECRALLSHLRALLAFGVTHLDEAEVVLRDALSIVEKTGAAGYEPFLRVEAARLAELRGDLTAGASELAEASRQFRRMGAAAHAERLGEPSGAAV